MSKSDEVAADTIMAMKTAAEIEAWLSAAFDHTTPATLQHLAKVMGREDAPDPLEGETADEYRERLNFKMPEVECPKPQRQTVRVRIAVAVDQNGKWEARGGDDAGDLWAERMAREDLLRNRPRSHVVHFIEATIPLPESVTVEGEVAE